MNEVREVTPGTAPRASGPPSRAPAAAYLTVSAVFHYLGPAFAVLLFSRVDAVGVAWLRIASAALIFVLWRRPWRYFAQQNAAVTALPPNETA